MKMRSQRGAITLEACVAVLAFLILMLLLSSLFVMFMAQNVTAHTVLQTSESLSMETYLVDRVIMGEDEKGSVGAYLTQFIAKMCGSSKDNPYFAEDEHWYEMDQTHVEAAAKNRFIGFLSGGNETEADKLLKNMNVVNGLSGLDFSQSYVADGTLHIVLKYNLEYDFNIWKVGNVEVEQRTCSKLWK